MAKGKYQDWLTEEGLLQLEAWARDGLTEEQIAHNMGVATKTLFNWKNAHLPILHALKRGKEVVDIQVENALLKRALGYSYKEVTKEKVFNPESGQYELMTTKEVSKEVVPDTTAQIFWLKNRRPDQWRDKRDVSVEGEVNTNNPFAGLSTEELRKIINDG